LWLTTEILVESVVFADVTLTSSMDLATLYATRLWHWLVSVLGATHKWWSFLPIFTFIKSCYGPSWQIVGTLDLREGSGDSLARDGWLVKHYYHVQQ
jgi:hypothetical protein